MKNNKIINSMKLIIKKIKREEKNKLKKLKIENKKEC